MQESVSDSAIVERNPVMEPIILELDKIRLDGRIQEKQLKSYLNRSDKVYYWF